MVEITLSPKTLFSPLDEVRIKSVKINPTKTIENMSYVCVITGDIYNNFTHVYGSGELA